jgi:hypothetical protein
MDKTRVMMLNSLFPSFDDFVCPHNATLHAQNFQQNSLISKPASSMNAS